MEFKAPGYRSTAKFGLDGIPGYYLMQMHMNMYLSGCTWGVFVVMDYEAWDIIPIYMELDMELVNGALPFIDKFWACVVQDIAPPKREVPYRPLGPTRTLEGHVKEGSPLAAGLSMSKFALDLAQADYDSVVDAIKRDMVAENTDPAPYISTNGTEVSIKWKESKGREIIKSKQLLLWVDSLVQTIKEGNKPLTEEFAQKFDPATFIKTSEPSRRFIPKVKED